MTETEHIAHEVYDRHADDQAAFEEQARWLRQESEPYPHYNALRPSRAFEWICYALAVTGIGLLAALLIL